MKRMCLLTIAALGWLAVIGGGVQADSLLAPGDFILAIDTDAPSSNSSSPAGGGEDPLKVIDGDNGSKYLNFGGLGSGFIVTPGGSTTVQSFQMVTGGDAEGRDPSAFNLFGTNDPITSLNNSDGLAENWTLIDGFNLSGPLALPAARGAVGPVVPLTNGTAWDSYKMVFTSLKDPGGIFQLAEISFFESNDGSGTDILDPLDPILGIHFGPASRFPGNEPPENAVDQTLAKYLNFGKENTGFIVTPTSGPDAVRAFRITTANDSDERDPTSWELWGTDDAITELQNGQGDAENWVLVDSGSVDLPLTRNTLGYPVLVDNDTAYTSYKMVFPTLRNTDTANSMQIAEVRFYNEAIPEPSTLALAALAMLGFCGACYRRKG